MTEKKKFKLFGKLQRPPKEKWKTEEFSELEYKPITVKELEQVSSRISSHYFTTFL